MPKSITIALAVLCAVLAGVLLQVWRENRCLRQMTQMMAEEVAEQQQQSESGKSAAQGLAAEVAALKERIAVHEAAAAARATATAAPKLADPTPTLSQPAPAAAGEKAPDFLGNFAKMMEKPEMRDAMRAQQKLMLDMLYGNLFSKLKLTPEELDRLKEILTNRQMASMTMLGSGDMQERMAAVLEAQQQAETSVKELLNDEQYKLYQDYEATVGERMQLTQLNQQLTQKSMPLDEAQQEELITIMIEEREKTGLASTKERHAEWLNGVPPDEVLNQRLEQQAEVNQRVYERSSDTLSEPQRTELKTFQEGQLQMQKLGIQMMKGFMSQEKEPAAP